MTPRSIIVIILTCLVLVSTLNSFAGDAIRQVCIGFISLDNGNSPKNIEKLVVVYSDQRSGADKRKITLSAVRNGKTYAGSDIAAASVAHVKVANVTDQKDVLFDGTVEGLDGGKGIELVGDYTTDAGKVQSIKATLESSEIPP